MEQKCCKIDKSMKVYIAGHRGMVGSAILRKMKQAGYENFVLRTSKELDLREQTAVREFFKQERPDCVVLAAAKVGGIMANMTSPASFMYDNLMIQNNVINSSFENGVKKLLFLGSSCIYPRLAPQPMKEEYLLDGKVEPTNEGYAIAKIAGMKMCEMYNRQYGTDYISVMPCNLYGKGDNYDLQSSHVVPALIRKFHEAKVNNMETVEIWGTGQARREFLYVDDMAEASLFLMENYSGSSFFNVGSGYDITISELAETIKEVTGFEGKMIYDTSKPDGMPQKVMDVSRLAKAGWSAKTSLKDGLSETYEWYREEFG